MTVNCNSNPNSLRLTGDTIVSHHFGGLAGPLTPVVLPGSGHRPHVVARFTNGVVMSLDPATATDLARELPAALLKLSLLPDCSGIAAEVTE